MVALSFDGASVMLETQNGAAAKLQAMCETTVIVMHAVAHVEQLTMSDAFKEVTFFRSGRVRYRRCTSTTIAQARSAMAWR